MAEETLDFYPSRSHVVVLAAVTLGLVVASGALAWFGFDAAQVSGASAALLAVSGGGVGVLVFGGFTLLVLRRLVLPRWPVLTLDHDGLVDWLPNVGVEQVSWSEVTGTRTAHLAGRRVLAVDVADPQAVVRRQRTVVRRGVAAAHTRLVGTPVVLKPGSIRCSASDLRSALSRYTDPRVTEPDSTGPRGSTPAPRSAPEAVPDQARRVGVE